MKRQEKSLTLISLGKKMRVVERTTQKGHGSYFAEQQPQHLLRCAEIRDLQAKATRCLPASLLCAVLNGKKLVTDTISFPERWGMKRWNKWKEQGNDSSGQGWREMDMGKQGTRSWGGRSPNGDLKHARRAGVCKIWVSNTWSALQEEFLCTWGPTASPGLSLGTTCFAEQWALS